MLVTILNIIVEYKEALLQGLLVTLELSAVIWLLGLLVGTALGYAGAQYPQEIGQPIKIVSFVLSGVPILVLLFWFNYPFQQLLDVVISPFAVSVAAISLVNIFAVAGIVRVSLSEFPYQYIVAGKVSGMKSKEIFRKIQFPIIFRQILPSLLTTQVAMLQLTLFASLISVNEIFKVAQDINAIIYKPIEIYSALALFFLAICLPLNGIALWLKQRYTRNLSEK